MQSPTNYGQVNDIVLGVLKRPAKSWNALFAILLLVLLLGIASWIYQINHGLEWSGVNQSISWGIYITNFVFWIGIAHAGTLISAILYLTRASFRVSLSRIAEAMTIVAVITAGLFPIIHLGRALYAFWIIPYPNQRELWVNFKSPLVWDAFAITTYLFVSMSFFLLGLIPDLASARDETKGWKHSIYRIFACGFRGTHYQWLSYLRGYLLIAALVTPLVISVHSIVSWDFAVSSVPGWHSTIFAPYFVVGAIFSGCAMVLLIIIPLRSIFKDFQLLIKVSHLEAIAKILLFTSIILSLCYLVETFMAFYSGSLYERSLYQYRFFGELKTDFRLMVVLNSVLPLLFCFNRARTSLPILFLVSVGVIIGMWLERFLIIISSLSHGFTLLDWNEYNPEWAEIWISVGSCAWFAIWMMLFFRFLPSIAIAEIKESNSNTSAKGEQ